MMVLRNPGPTPTVVRSGKLQIRRTRSRSARTEIEPWRSMRMAATGWNSSTRIPATSPSPWSVRRASDTVGPAGSTADSGSWASTTVIAERGNPGSNSASSLGTRRRASRQDRGHRTAGCAGGARRHRFAEVGGQDRRSSAATLAVRREFRAHDGPITAIAWHPTKPILHRLHRPDREALERGNGQDAGGIPRPDEPAHDLTFSPSGQRLGCQADRRRASGSPDRSTNSPRPRNRPMGGKTCWPP